METLHHFAPMLLNGLAGSFVLFTLLWMIQVVRKDAGIVDIGWTAGVGAMAISAAFMGEGWMPRRILLGIMGGIWSLRLVLYILKDRIFCEKEDSRYQRLRAHWGKRANAWFFVFFTSQSLLVVLFALPFLPAANKTSTALSFFDVLAVLVWLLAMGGEWLADLQLARFRNKPENKGKVCRDGLWNHSRHPNYFFECVHWLAYPLLAAGSPGFWLALLGPFAMYFFLMKITGIPHVEREALAKRGDAYREYQQTTPMLIPWPKKQNSCKDPAGRTNPWQRRLIMIDLMELAEKRKMPDVAIRFGIRKLLKERLLLERLSAAEDELKTHDSFIELMKAGPVAVATDTANEQHYEVPSQLFETFMGPHLKYSCGLWPTSNTTLAESEEAMLELTCERAGLVDGMNILELGCGWGSLSLWMAKHYPNARITAVSNSSSQKKHIDARGFRNLEVVTADMNDFSTDTKYDRVVSVEMFEHMRNWPELLRRINGWLKDDGRLFIHIFVHRQLAYLFNEAGRNNWMAENFFKEGMMPADNLLCLVDDDLMVEKQWQINGKHYARTLRAWLAKMDRNANDATAILERHHGMKEARRQYGRWRIFFMACEELFAYGEGEEWYVSHYLLKKR